MQSAPVGAITDRDDPFRGRAVALLQEDPVRLRYSVDRAQAQERMERIGRKAVRSSEDYTRSWHQLEAVRAELLEVLK